MSAKSKLDALFEDNRKRQETAAQARKVEEDKRDVFLDQSMAKVEEVVRPAMEEMGQHLASKGWAYEIVTQKDETKYERDRDYPRHINASISLKMFEDGTRRHSMMHDIPALTVICDKSSKRVQFHECTMSKGKGGHAGGSGECSLEQLSKDLVQKKITKVVQYVLR